MKPSTPNNANQGPLVNPQQAQMVFDGSLRSAMGDPRYPGNNPLNAAEFTPRQLSSYSPYGDTLVSYAIPGVTWLPGIEQRIIQTRGANTPGDPALGLPPEVGDQLAAAPYGLPLGHGDESAFALGTDTGKLGSTGRNVQRKRSS